MTEMMVVRLKKMQGSGTKARRVKNLKGIDEAIKAKDATSQEQSLPKISADMINKEDLTEAEEMAAIMKLEEVSLRKFLEDEPDIYTLKDLKVRYK